MNKILYFGIGMREHCDHFVHNRATFGHNRNLNVFWFVFNLDRANISEGSRLSTQCPAVNICVSLIIIGPPQNY